MSNRCSNCSGRGTVECSNCDGKGRYEDSLSKFGRFITFDANPKLLKCYQCHGKGHHKCGDCYGRGFTK
jgi:DnaJ-class molecular chaperone